jgi:hypothetical protein
MALYQDVVQGPGATAAAVANKVEVGTLTLPQSARVITRIWITAGIVGTYAANKPLAGYIEVDSEDVPIKPLHIPIEPVAGYTTLGSVGPQEATKWVINCPAVGGAKLTFNMIADAAPNAAPEVQITVEFSDGASPFPGPQIHMKAGEPAVSLSTSDNGTANLTDIEIWARHLHMIVAYGACTTLVADTALVATCEVTSDDFAQAGPHKFSLNPALGGDANAVGSTLALTKIPQDMGFRAPGQKQTLSCVVTMRDAISTAPVANWCVIYS